MLLKSGLRSGVVFPLFTYVCIYLFWSNYILWSFLHVVCIENITLDLTETNLLREVYYYLLVG